LRDTGVTYLLAVTVKVEKREETSLLNKVLNLSKLRNVRGQALSTT